MKIKSLAYWQFTLNYADDSELTLSERRMIESLLNKGLIHYDKKASYTEAMGLQANDLEDTQEAEDQVYQLD